MKKSKDLLIEPETSKVNLSFHSQNPAPVLVNYNDEESSAITHK